MDRDLVVQRLIEDELKRLERGRQSLWLMRVLENGFQGFGNMSEAELMSELRRRGLKAEFESPVEPDDEADDDEDEDDDEDGEIRAVVEEVARSRE